MTKKFEQAPTHVVYYAADDRGFYRVAPPLVAQLQVLRCTPTQVLVQLRGQEVRFRRDDGWIVGGGYGSARIEPVNEATLAAAAESRLRRDMWNAVQQMERDAVNLAAVKLQHVPKELLASVQEHIRRAQEHLTQAATVLAPKDKE